MSAAGADLPEYVYLVTVDTEWPVSAIADDQPTMAYALEEVVERRRRSNNVTGRDQVHIWRVPVKDVTEMELIPPATVEPELRVKQ